MPVDFRTPLSDAERERLEAAAAAARADADATRRRMLEIAPRVRELVLELHALDVEMSEARLREYKAYSRERAAREELGESAPHVVASRAANSAVARSLFSGVFESLARPGTRDVLFEGSLQGLDRVIADIREAAKASERQGRGGRAAH